MSIDYEVVNHNVARIHLNRPRHRNPISPDDSRAILSHLRTAQADPSVRVVVFSGEGDHFSSGADMAAYNELMHAVRDGKRPLADYISVLQVTADIVRLLRAPGLLSIAAVQGWTVGQGLEMSIASDFIVADETSRFYFAETQIGLTMTSGCAKLLPQMVGLGNARRLMLFGEKITAGEADRMGLLTRVVPSGQALTVALEMAEQLAAGAPLALTHQKRFLDAAAAMDLSAVQDLEMHAAGWLALTEDALEADLAFSEKRTPQFHGH